MPAHFHNQEVEVVLKDKRKLSTFLDNLVHQHLEGIKKISLNYIFCNDEYLLTMNQHFLNHDTLTDIITFDLSEKENELLGEIYISTERVKENAAKFNTIENRELHRVVFHGALHLCGFADKKPSDKKIMTEQEDACLQQYLG